MNREEMYKEIIKNNLNNVLDSGFVPELGEYKKGKVRETYYSKDGEKVTMIATDRVSAFDYILPVCIPFKGAILNAFNRWAMEESADIIKNAMLGNPDPNVIVQKKLQNSGFECVVRGYVWGSLADDYEKGKRDKCGIGLPDDLLRYERLPKPIFTPTTKAETGHDIDVTINDIIHKVGEDAARDIFDASMKLFERGSMLAENAGMIFVDTKYEFGLKQNTKIPFKQDVFLIDEANTPDSSRFVSEEEYNAKWPRIVEEMKTLKKKKYKNVSELLKANPELKIKEESKQFVRDVLIAGGYKPGSGTPALTSEEIVETAWRYINSYEKLTGLEFHFPESYVAPKKRIMHNLIQAGIAYGGCVVPMGASEKDAEHWKKIEQALEDVKIPYTPVFYASAHKQTQDVLDYIKHIDTSIEPVVYITFAGKSNGLGPVVAGNSRFPVITCPVFKDKADYQINIHSSLQMPSKVPLLTCIEPGNAVLAAKKIIDALK